MESQGEETKLSELWVWCCDVQGSDAKPGTGQVIDIAWSFGSCTQGFGEHVSTLVGLEKGRKFGRRARQLTGIDPKMLRGAPSLSEVQGTLEEAFARQPDGAWSLAHYAQYEARFIRDFYTSDAQPLGEFLCTHQIARRVLPGLPRKGLRALAGYFGAHLQEHKRSEVHVQATELIWCELVELLEQEHDVTTLGELLSFCKKPAPKNVPREFAFSRERRLAMPRTPGVYRMLGRQGEVLYVGKATSLKSRINSYFTGKLGEGERKLEMATQVWDVSVTEVSTPLEAALLEAQEIKMHDPPYNILLKKGNRQLLYVHQDYPWLAKEGMSQEQGFTLGPTSNRELFEATSWLVQSMLDGQPRVEVLYELDREDLFMEALSSWMERVDLVVDGEVDAARWWSYGEALIREANRRREERRAAKQAAMLEVDDEDDEDEETPAKQSKASKRKTWSWSKEGIERAFDGLVRRSVRHVFRGELIAKLQGAHVKWTPARGPLAGTPHQVQVPNYIDEGGALNLSDFDVMRVLLSELKRIVTTCEGEVLVTLRDTSSWGVEELTAQLELV